MLGNKVSAPQTEVNKSILKTFLKTATPIIGIYLLSNLAIFIGRDYLTPGLSEKQLKIMDKHNDHHHHIDLINILGSGLGTGLNIVNPGASEEIKKIKEAGLAEENGALDQDVADLPPPLNHKHGSVDSTG